MKRHGIFGIVVLLCALSHAGCGVKHIVAAHAITPTQDGGFVTTGPCIDVPYWYLVLAVPEPFLQFLPPPPQIAHVYKFDANGNREWFRYHRNTPSIFATSSGTDHLYSRVVELHNGSLLATGVSWFEFYLKILESTDIVLMEENGHVAERWTGGAWPSVPIPLDDGGFAVVYPGGFRRFSADGALLLQNEAGGIPAPNAAVQDPEGGVVVVGEAAHQPIVFRCDLEGNPLWSQPPDMLTTAPESAVDVVVTARNTLVVLVAGDRNGANGDRIVLLEFNLAGDVIRSAEIVGVRDYLTRSIVEGRDGTLYLAAHAKDYQSGGETVVGGAMLARFDAQLNLLQTTIFRNPGGDVGILDLGQADDGTLWLAGEVVREDGDGMYQVHASEDCEILGSWRVDGRSREPLEFAAKGTNKNPKD